MNKEGIKMETITEKGSMTNSDFSKALNVVLNTMSDNVLISKKEYNELIKIKSNFDVELKTFVTSYNRDKELLQYKYNNQIDKLREECSEKDIKITQLTNEIEQLRKQIKKRNKRWTIF